MALKPLSIALLNLAAAIVLLAMCACCQASSVRPSPDWLMAEKHEKWMTEFGRTYADEEEKAMRFEIFRKKVAYIELFNQAANKTYKLAANKFSDLTDEEFLARHTGYKSTGFGSMKASSSSSFMYGDEDDSIPPASIDWRDLGAVTDVKDQGDCGSCWAFSAVGALEGANQIKTKELIPLSEQEIVDCSKRNGCSGGYAENAFDYIKGHRGLSSNSYYPYVGSDMNHDPVHIIHMCESSIAMPRFAAITGYERVPANNESALMMVVAKQPVSVGIDGVGEEFKLYKEGIFSGPCGTDMNHAVMVVGYGEESDGMKFWVVKNSWGTDWGEKGYMRILKDVDDKQGLCGITKDASYPILT